MNAMLGAGLSATTIRYVLAAAILMTAFFSGPADAQEKGAEPYQQLIFVSVTNNIGDPCTTSGCDIYLPAVPAGKRLVVQHISGSVVLQSGFAFSGTLRTGDFNSNSIRIQLMPNSQSLSSGTLQLVSFSQAVTGYVFSGQRPLFQFGAVGSGILEGSSVEVSLTGYLVNVK